MKKLKKVLIIRFSAIGDIVLTTPVVRCVKQQLPDVEVHYATKASFKSFVEPNPNVDKVHLLGESLIKLIIELRKEKFDLVIDLHKNLRTTLIKLALMTPSISFDKLNFRKYLYVKWKLKMPKNHVVDRYMDALSKYNIVNDDLGLDYFIPEKDEIEWNWLPETHRNGYVAVAIGGTHYTKRLPIKRLIELCDKIAKPVVLLGGKEDIFVADEIEQFFKPTASSKNIEEQLKNDFGKKTVIFNATGKFNLNQSASLIKHSIALFTHDTGLMHIASAFKKDVFSIWGNTTPELGFYPYQTKFTIFENKNLTCRPCSKIGLHDCPKGHFKCMNEVKLDFYLP